MFDVKRKEERKKKKNYLFNLFYVINPSFLHLPLINVNKLNYILEIYIFLYLCHLFRQII